MKLVTRLLVIASLLSSVLLLSACSTPEVAGARNSGVDRRQDRIDARTGARTERWKERGEREDARSRARFDAM